MSTKLLAEFIGTFWLVLGGCGSAVLAAAFPGVGIGLLGVSLAFGLTVLTGAYALGPVSGGHFNPAVSIGLWAGGRFPAAQVLSYVIAQVAGAIVEVICRVDHPRLRHGRGIQPLAHRKLRGRAVAAFTRRGRGDHRRSTECPCH